MLPDSHGRTACYLRLSITDRCNFNCLYCRDKASQNFVPHDEILRYEEMIRLVRIANSLGIEKVRLTGGEPFARKGVLDFLAALRASFPQIALSVTTNGSLLGGCLPLLRDIKLSSINISLDSLSRDSFSHLTGQDCLQTVLNNIDAALMMGIRIKLNAVAIRGITDSQINDFLHIVRFLPLDLRFIEFMPLGCSTTWNGDLFLSSDELLQLIKLRADIRPLMADERPSDKYSGPARMYQIEGNKGRIGFISAMSNHFCQNCNRLRITSRGALRTCLFADKEYNLKGLLRNPRISDDRIARLVRIACEKKPLGSDLVRERKDTSIIHSQMSYIGG